MPYIRRTVALFSLFFILSNLVIAAPEKIEEVIPVLSPQNSPVPESEPVSFPQPESLPAPLPVPNPDLGRRYNFQVIDNVPGHAQAINNRGHFTTFGSTYDDQTQKVTSWGYFYDGNKAIFLGNDIQPRNLNDSDAVIGDTIAEEIVQTPEGPVSISTSRAFIWRKGNFWYLPHLPGTHASRAYAINRRGQVVGESYKQTVQKDPQPEHKEEGQEEEGGEGYYVASEVKAVLWTNGKPQDLGSLGGSYTEASDINNNSQIVGHSITTDGRGEAFIWEKGVMRELLPPDANRVGSWANFITENGTVAGVVYLKGANEDLISKPFIWEKGKVGYPVFSGADTEQLSFINGFNKKGYFLFNQDSVWDRVSLKNATDILLGPPPQWEWFIDVMDITDNGTVLCHYRNIHFAPGDNDGKVCTFQLP